MAQPCTSFLLSPYYSICEALIPVNTVVFLKDRKFSLPPELELYEPWPHKYKCLISLLVDENCAKCLKSFIRKTDFSYIRR